MTDHAGEALELALALLRMPAQRFTLRERPLPADIDWILPIAAGSRDALAVAAQATGEPEPLVLEAVQFYLQEILFFPDADAYRILAVTRDADIVQMQQHHRQLQRWLHPDRRGNDLESGFASRVNQAWNTLRSDERRQAYDAVLQQQPVTTSNQATVPAASMGWHRTDAGSQARWRQALPLTVLAIVCVLLVVLMARRPEEAAFQEWRTEAETAVADLTDPDAATVHLHDAANTPIQTASTRDPVQRNQRMPRPASDSTQDRMQLGKAATVDVQPPTLPPLMPMPDDQAAGQTIDQGTEQMLEPVQSSLGNVGNVTTMPAQAPSGPPVLDDQPRQTIVDTATVPRDRTTIAASAQASRPRITRPGRRTPAPAAPKQLLAIDEPVPAHTSTPADTAMPGGTPDLVERVRLARERAREVTAYISDPQARTPPVWNDLDIQMQAEGLRSDFHAGDEGKRIALQRADWRISGEVARLQAAYHCSGRCDDGDHGVLRMQMGWRNGMWLVRELELEPAP